MKAHAWVMLKTTILDPHGKTIHYSLDSPCNKSINAVRREKFFVLDADVPVRVHSRLHA